MFYIFTGLILWWYYYYYYYQHLFIIIIVAAAATTTTAFVVVLCPCVCAGHRKFCKSTQRIILNTHDRSVLSLRDAELDSVFKP